MIYTITFNPAIDYLLTFDEPLTKHQKTSNYHFLPGGKGINASLLLQNFHVSNQAVLVSGGFTGKHLLKMLKDKQISVFNLESNFNTRINVKTNFSGQTIEQNSTSKMDFVQIESQLMPFYHALKPNDIVMIMGSLPEGITLTHLETIIQKLVASQVHIVLDIPHKKVSDFFKYEPLIVKPNKKELASWFKTSINSEKEILHWSQELLKKGAKKVLVSLDKSGSIYVDQEQNQFYIAGVPIQEVNASGAGDAMLAGFIYAFTHNLSLEESLKLAAGAGTATAASTGIATEELARKYSAQVKIKKIGGN